MSLDGPHILDVMEESVSSLLGIELRFLCGSACKSGSVLAEKSGLYSLLEICFNRMWIIALGPMEICQTVSLPGLRARVLDGQCQT
jgi:hypothetical protein